MNAEKILGNYFKTVYRDIESGYTIFLFRPQLTANVVGKLKNGVISCKGTFPKLDPNIPIELSGTWESDKYGWSFQVIDFVEKSWNAMVAIDFLRSIKGIGEKESQKIFDEFSGKTGDEFFEKIKSPAASLRLSMATGFSQEKSKTIVQAINAQSEKRTFMKFIFDHNGRMKNVDKLYSAYGSEGLKMLQEDPYKVGQQIGLSLESCDMIAKTMQKDMKSENRILSYISRYLEKEMMSGNVYAKLLDLQPEIIKQLQTNTNEKFTSFDIVRCIVHQDKVFTYTKEGDAFLVYLNYLKKAEDSLARNIFRLQTSGLETNYDETYVEYAESIAGFQFAPEQRGAFRLLKKTGIGILTGGPGTGKTTTVKGIIDAWEKMYPEKKIRLCAPTGRAAQRMSESTGRPATTIHRLLEYKPFEKDSDEIQCKNALDPIDADFIIVDEVSMLDCLLASLFFDAIKAGTMVIMVGDINQLQSVGAGDVLNDMIKSGRIPVERLIKTYRQAENSNIIKNANEINVGHEYLLTDPKDFEIYQTQAITDKVVEIVKQYHKPDDLFYAQVLSPSHKGDGGVTEINKRLQEELNPGNAPHLNYGRNKFKLRDKIIMIKNNADKGYFNGDVGYITNIDNDTMTVRIQNNDIQLSHGDLDDVKLAYSMTIHKSQGSEFPVVIIALPNSGMLKRNLLYTAVTRAKGKVIIIQQSGAISIAVHKNEVGKRKTTLLNALDDCYNNGSLQ